MYVENWNEVLEAVYRESRLIKLEDFKPLYKHVFQQKEFYI